MLLDASAASGLVIWRDVLEKTVRDAAPDLSMRQWAILMIVYLEPPPHTVRGLATRLNVTKPVISRALDAFATLGLAERMGDPKDRRNVLVKRTISGALMVETMGDRMLAALKAASR